MNSHSVKSTDATGFLENFPTLTEDARKKYIKQRAQARDRGIAWEFTFESWCRVWDESGKWPERGRRGECYVMARHGDVGPYSPTNVAIVQHKKNVADAHVFNASLRSRLGSGTGVVIDKRCKSRPYYARAAGKDVGWFASMEEAVAARAAFVSVLQKTRGESTP